MVEIPVGAYVALVDDADAELVRQYKWHPIKAKTGFRIYAQTIVGKRPHRKTWYMHRMILGLPHGDERHVDHKNHNGLDNRRDNIRIATRSQNSANRLVGKRYKGVHHEKRRPRPTYYAMIQVNQKMMNLGCFHTPEEAAICYNMAALKYFGEFAVLNQVPLNWMRTLDLIPISAVHSSSGT